MFDTSNSNLISLICWKKKGKHIIISDINRDCIGLLVLLQLLLLLPLMIMMMRNSNSNNNNGTLFVFEYSCKSLYVEVINKWLLETELYTCAKID